MCILFKKKKKKKKKKKIVYIMLHQGDLSEDINKVNKYIFIKKNITDNFDQHDLYIFIL